jgi:hypothetical protein
MTTDLLIGARIKIDRAKTHFSEIEAKVGQFFEREPYTVLINSDPNASKAIRYISPSVEQVFQVRVNEEIPADWAAIIGDIVHNLRSSLDLLAVAMARLNGVTAKRKIDEIYFPFGPDKNTFEKNALPQKLAHVSAGARDFVKKLEPYQGGNGDLLWRLHKIDIIDKHYLLIPVGASFDHFLMVYRTRANPGEEFLELPALKIDMKQPIFPIRGGEVLTTVTFGGMASSGDVTNIEMQHIYKMPFAVAFGEGQIFERAPITPTLQKLIQSVEGVINAAAADLFS